ncbi:MAG TPA: diaminopimelate epimerase [Acidimicrobiales bacterium]|nr:diaminopimelate epimerase [Acidimicrobiales bacterium]
MRLTKHHGLGNDFLVLLESDVTTPVTPALARAVCDRHRGVGADGLLHVGPSATADVAMVLYNADGGRAEMSGNGISCLAQAVVVAGIVPAGVVTVSTDAGLRRVELVAGEAGEHLATVDMGPAKVGEDEVEWLGDDVMRAARVDVGNPHLVLHAPMLDRDFDFVARGASINELVPEGINVELVAPGPMDGELTMRVYERGVGLTEACGTGACAVAAAAHQWGLCDTRVTIRQPGGPAVIELADSITMTVPVVHVATIEYHAA